MPKRLLEEMKAIAEEKSLPIEEVKQIFIDSFTEAVKKTIGEDAEVEVKFTQQGDLKIILKKKVKKRVRNPNLDISLEEAQKIKPDAQPGDYIETELSPEKVSRLAIVKAKDLLRKRIYEAELKSAYERYKGKEGQIVAGTVKKIDRRGMLIQLKDAEAYLPADEQIPGDRYKQGDPIKALILKVDERGRIILSRTHEKFLEELFKLEIPEVRDGIVKIKGIARVPGQRSKVAVTSLDSRVEPVGACVGVKGSRIQTIVKELNNEKIDVIQWSNDPLVFIARALSTSRIIHEKINHYKKQATVVVPDDAMKQVIGVNGLNARLASKLTGYRITVISESDYQKKGVSLVKEYSKEEKKMLIDNGFLTTDTIVKRGIEGLMEIPGMTEDKARRIFEIAQKYSEVKENA